MPPTPSSSPGRPVDRANVLRGGLAGIGVGLLLLALALFFLVRGFDEPGEVLGVLLPLSVALLALSLGAMALVPLRFGDTTTTSPRVIARLLRGLGLLGVVVTALACLRGELPWTVGAVAPLGVVVALVASAGRFSRLSSRDPS